MAATIIKPFVREQCTWCVATHGAFQKSYYADKIGENPNSRNRYAGHAYFDDCLEFCERWDQASFDPDYDTLDLEFFRPMIDEVFAHPACAEHVLNPGVRLALCNT